MIEQLRLLAVQLWAVLEPMDLMVLEWFNVKMTHPILDQFWLAITQLHKNWVVMLVLLPLLIIAGIYKYRWKVLQPIVAVALTVGVADAIAYRGIKANFPRLRPFQNPEISSWVRHVGHSHGPSFPSNHSTNCFAGAYILSWYFRRYSHYFYTLAAFVALSRVALGVHYPSDIVAGMILGIFVGFLIKAFVLSNIRWISPDRNAPKKDSDSGNWRTRSRRLSGV